MAENDNLQTPEYVYGALGPFDLDPCSGETTEIAKCNWWIGRNEDGLQRKWFGYVFCNPPFSNKEVWIEKFIQHGNGILLLPERGSAPWFGALADACGVYFVMGKKINFIGGKSSNNVGSCLFPLGHMGRRRLQGCELPGLLVVVASYRSRQKTCCDGR